VGGLCTPTEPPYDYRRQTDLYRDNAVPFIIRTVTMTTNYVAYESIGGGKIGTCALEPLESNLGTPPKGVLEAKPPYRYSLRSWSAR
jgi:hypothetical protein